MRRSGRLTRRAGRDRLHERREAEPGGGREEQLGDHGSLGQRRGVRRTEGRRHERVRVQPLALDREARRDVRRARGRAGNETRRERKLGAELRHRVVVGGGRRVRLTDHDHLVRTVRAGHVQGRLRLPGDTRRAACRGHRGDPLRERADVRSRDGKVDVRRVELRRGGAQAGAAHGDVADVALRRGGRGRLDRHRAAVRHARGARGRRCRQCCRRGARNRGDRRAVRDLRPGDVTTDVGVRATVSERRLAEVRRRRGDGRGAEGRVGDRTTVAVLHDERCAAGDTATGRRNVEGRGRRRHRNDERAGRDPGARDDAVHVARGEVTGARSDDLARRDGRRRRDNLTTCADVPHRFGHARRARAGGEVLDLVPEADARARTRERAVDLQLTLAGGKVPELVDSAGVGNGARRTGDH